MLTPLNTYQVSRERRLHISLNPNPHIIQLYATFEDETNYYLALVSPRHANNIIHVVINKSVQQVVECAPPR